MKAFTDYPIPFLGDTEGQLAPIRSCTVTGYDGNKYCSVIIEGFEFEIKAGYLYTKSGRVGEVPNINTDQLPHFFPE